MTRGLGPIWLVWLGGGLVAAVHGDFGKGRRQLGRRGLMAVAVGVGECVRDGGSVRRRGGDGRVPGVCDQAVGGPERTGPNRDKHGQAQIRQPSGLSKHCKRV